MEIDFTGWMSARIFRLDRNGNPMKREHQSDKTCTTSAPTQAMDFMPRKPLYGGLQVVALAGVPRPLDVARVAWIPRRRGPAVKGTWNKSVAFATKNTIVPTFIFMLPFGRNHVPGSSDCCS
jgi:hypothetical protein